MLNLTLYILDHLSHTYLYTHIYTHTTKFLINSVHHNSKIHITFNFFSYIDSRERKRREKEREKGEREGERRKQERKENIDVREKLIGCLLHAPNQRLNPQPGHMPWLGIEPVTFQFAGQRPTDWATPARAKRHTFKVALFFTLKTRKHSYLLNSSKN